MPYTNVPRHLWGKMDRCVERVQGRQPGLSKPRAIAICHESIVKEFEMANAKQRRIQRRKKERQEKKALEKVIARQEAGETLAMEEIKLLAASGYYEKADATPEQADQEIAEAIAGTSEPIEVKADPGDVLESGPAEKSEPIVVEKETEEEPEEKAQDASEMVLPAGGAMTFGELDAFREAMDEAHEARAVIKDFELLVNNAAAATDIKELPDRIVALGQEMQSRLEDAKEIEEEKPGIVDRVKAALTGRARNDLPDSAFAYIEPGGKKDEDGRTVPRSLRHYPIHDAAHVRNALSRAAAAMNKGGKTGDIARKAMPKIRAAAKKMGIGKPAKKDISGIRIEKAKDGTYRWFGWVSNKFRDRDWPAEPKLGGQILTEEAHKEFVGWVWEDPAERMPELWLWHTPGTAHEKTADWIDYADGFLVMSGPLTDQEAKRLNRLKERYDVAMSHGLIRNKDDYDEKNGYILKYRTFEASPLPREHAANEWTDIDTLEKEVDMGFTPERRKFLVDAYEDEDKVMSLEADTEGRSKAIEELGVEWKDVTEALEDLAESAEEAVEETAQAVAGEDLAAAVSERLGLGKLSEFLESQQGVIDDQGKALKTLTEAVEKLAKDDDEKIAEQLRPKADVKAVTEPIWVRRLSQSEETEVDEEVDKELVDSVPGIEIGEANKWLADALSGGESADKGAVPK